MHIYRSPIQKQRDLTAEFRELKLKFLQSGINFEIDKSVVKKYNTELSFIKKEFNDGLITGSLALNLFGLLERDIFDIDIMIDDENMYSGYLNETYSDDETGNLKNRLGYIKFNYKKSFFSSTKTYEVDFFKNTNSQYIEFDFGGHKLKLHHPIEIISAKISIQKRQNSRLYSKHYNDLEIILRKFEIL